MTSRCLSCFTRPRAEANSSGVTVSGTWGAEKFDAIARELLGKLDAAGFAPAGPPVYARYDPPWTPWFLRKNEILVPLAESRTAAGGGA